MATHDPFTPPVDHGHTRSREAVGYRDAPDNSPSPDPVYDDTQYDRRPRRIWNGFAGWTPDVGNTYPDGMTRPDGSRQGDK